MKTRRLATFIGCMTLIAAALAGGSRALAYVECDWGPTGPISDGGDGYVAGIDCVNGTRYIHYDAYAANVYWPNSITYTGQVKTVRSFGNSPSGYTVSASAYCQNGQTYTDTHTFGNYNGQAVMRCNQPAGGWSLVKGSGWGRTY
jgi:hypothetical protein